MLQDVRFWLSLRPVYSLGVKVLSTFEDLHRTLFICCHLSLFPPSYPFPPSVLPDCPRNPQVSLSGDDCWWFSQPLSCPFPFSFLCFLWLLIDVFVWSDIVLHSWLFSYHTPPSHRSGDQNLFFRRRDVRDWVRSVCEIERIWSHRGGGGYQLLSNSSALTLMEQEIICWSCKKDNMILQNKILLLQDV